MKYLQSDSAHRYFTPPDLQRLDLDLANLSGGGWAPAQFFGATHDGREVYIRYRGGQLSVHIAENPGADALAPDSRCILDVRIGPTLHNGISLGQICGYLNITINGEHPPIPTKEEAWQEGWHDLGGSITYYDVLRSSTLATQIRFISAAMDAIPEAVLVQPVLDQFKETGYRICPTAESLSLDHSFIVLGGTLSAEGIESLPPHYLQHPNLRAAAVIFMTTSGFQYSIRKYNDDLAKHIQSVTGKTILVAGQVDDCMYGSFALHSQFSNEDNETRSLVQKFDQLLDEFFPAYQVACIDLMTGEAEAQNHTWRYDPNVIAWANAGDDHWLSIFNVGKDYKNPRWLGIRPVERL